MCPAVKQEQRPVSKSRQHKEIAKSWIAPTTHVTRGWFAMTPQKQTYRELVTANWQRNKNVSSHPQR
jgi:hypothetical protein